MKYDYEKSLYQKIKEYCEILNVDENVDEMTLKRSYWCAAKKIHPDSNLNSYGANSNFQKLQEAYNFLKDENNRSYYKELKNKYDKEINNTENRKENSTFQTRRNEIKEHTNKYIFQRRDGSKIEIQPDDKYLIDNETIYKYKVNQYYNNMNIVDCVYGRINLEELFRSQGYCDFCVNNLLSRDNIYKSQIYYNGYIGHIEVANRNGIRYYRIVDKESFKSLDISGDIGDIRAENETDNIIEIMDYDIIIKEIGKIIINNKPLSQYLIFSDDLNIIDIVYSENIDFKKIKNNCIYGKEIRKLLEEDRLRQKIKDGGYLGQVLYNVENEDYNIVVDKEVEKILGAQSKRAERV